MDQPNNETQNFAPNEEHTEKDLRCRKIVEETLRIANLTPRDEMPDEGPNSRWAVYYEDQSNEILLVIEARTIKYPIKFVYCMPLFTITRAIVSDLESLLSSKNGQDIFKIEEEAVEEIVSEQATNLLANFIIHLPAVLFHNNYQALKESTISHIRKSVEPDLREYWQEQGKRSDFSLLGETGNLKDVVKLFSDIELPLLNIIETMDDEFSSFRKGAFRDRKVFLTPNTFSPPGLRRA